MSQPKKTKHRIDTPPEITAQPRQWSEHLLIDPDATYSSIAPEDLGGNALREATQSGWPPYDRHTLTFDVDAVSGARLDRPSGESQSNNLWAETLDLALEFGIGLVSSHRKARHRGGMEDEDCDEPTWVRDIDLTQGKVVEASLFDPGSEETVYETRKPRVNTDNDSPEHRFVDKPESRGRVRAHTTAAVAKHVSRTRARARKGQASASLTKR